MIAAAEVLEKQGFNIGTQIYVEAMDISPMCFRMSYLQIALRGIPATVRRGNSLSLELFDQAVTPAFLPFYRASDCSLLCPAAPPPGRAAYCPEMMLKQ